MKKIILLLAFIVQASAIFAQRPLRTSELFLEIADRGKFIVYLNDEYIGSAQGRFRFFEIADLNPTLTIFQDNRTLLKQRIRLEPNRRVISSFSERRGFQISTMLPILANNQYLLDDWNGMVNIQPGYPPGNPGYPGQSGYAMNPEDFSQFIASITREKFDNERIKIIEIGLKNSYFTTKQVGEVIRALDFEDQRLSIAKRAYPVTVDKSNYYILKDSFKFLGGQNGFMDFLKSVPPTN